MPRALNEKTGGFTLLRPEGFITGEATQDYSLTSTLALFIAAMSVVADVPIEKSAGNLERSGDYTIGDANWHEIRWDSSTQAIEIEADGADVYVSTSVPTTNGVRSGTAITATLGAKIANGASKMIKVAGAPAGSIFIAGNGATIRYLAHGDRFLDGIEKGTVAVQEAMNS